MERLGDEDVNFGEIWESEEVVKLAKEAYRNAKSKDYVVISRQGKRFRAKAFTGKSLVSYLVANHAAACDRAWKSPEAKRKEKESDGGAKKRQVKRAGAVALATVMMQGAAFEPLEMAKDGKKERLFEWPNPDSRTFRFADDKAAIFTWKIKVTSIWSYIGIPLVLLGLIGCVVVPMYPSYTRTVQWGCLYLLGLMFAIHILRHVLFGLVWCATLGKKHFWLLPDMWEDAIFPIYTFTDAADADAADANASAAAATITETTEVKEEEDQEKDGKKKEGAEKEKEKEKEEEEEEKVDDK